MNMITKEERILGGLWGSLAGDALGVPVEFQTRAAVQANPVTGMRGYGTHGQPPGTWSDDSSMLLCTVESLVIHEFSPEDMAMRFVSWAHTGYWTPHGTVFDIGNATGRALWRIAAGEPPLNCGGRGERDNGNGSLMRILPAALASSSQTDRRLCERIELVSGITHAHPRSQMACVFHAFLVQALMNGMPPQEALGHAQRVFALNYERSGELPHFRRLLASGIAYEPESSIPSDGYVLDTLTASLWCLLTTNNFRDCVLRAVNLGGDTDTTGCVAGGLAGVYYGIEAIPREWRTVLARADEVDALFNKFTDIIQ